MEWAGVSSASKCVRQSWAAEKARRRPPVGPSAHCSLMKSSGIYGETQRSSSGVPVVGKEFFTRGGYPKILDASKSPSKTTFIDLNY